MTNDYPPIPVGTRVILTGSGWSDMDGVEHGDVRTVVKHSVNGMPMIERGFMVFNDPDRLALFSVTPVAVTIEELFEDVHVNVAIGIQRSTVDALERLDTMVDEMRARA